jgi:motility quorum-sensing regulator/GCU-specific mRNA interferase toxin
MPVKRTPHHDLKAIQAKFADVDTLEITRRPAMPRRSAIRSRILSMSQALEPGDFIKSETAHNPPNHRLWHDTYNIPCDGLWCI